MLVRRAPARRPIRTPTARWSGSREPLRPVSRTGTKSRGTRTSMPCTIAPISANSWLENLPTADSLRRVGESSAEALETPALLPLDLHDNAVPGGAQHPDDFIQPFAVERLRHDQDLIDHHFQMS